MVPARVVPPASLLACVGLTFALALPAAAGAQAWAADVYTGGIQPRGVTGVGTSTNVVAALRYQGSENAFAYLTGGAPLDDEGSLWAGAGLGGRLEWLRRPRFRAGEELSLDGYSYGDRGEGTAVGAALHALSFVSASRSGSASGAWFELRGGHHRNETNVTLAGASDLWELGGRASKTWNGHALTADARWLTGDGWNVGFYTVSGVHSFRRGRLWASGGTSSGTVAEGSWELGGALTAGAWGELWASARREPTDPLYGNAARSSWNVGLSRAFGGVPGLLRGPEVESGALRIRVSRRVVPADADAVGVAGEFNRWQATPMKRSGGDWVLDVPAAPGVYRFAFVTGTGVWFVPEGYPGRLDDDMGGSLAVVVVP